MSFKNSFPTFVSKFLLKGGLNHIILRFLVLSFRSVFCGLNFKLVLYPIFQCLLIYYGTAALKMVSFEERSDNIFSKVLGIWLIMFGGWLDSMLMYWMLMYWKAKGIAFVAYYLSIYLSICQSAGLCSHLYGIAVNYNKWRTEHRLVSSIQIYPSHNPLQIFKVKRPWRI